MGRELRSQRLAHNIVLRRLPIVAQWDFPRSATTLRVLRCRRRADLLLILPRVRKLLSLEVMLDCWPVRTVQLEPVRREVRQLEVLHSLRVEVNGAEFLISHSGCSNLKSLKITRSDQHNE